MKSELTIEILKKEASKFAEIESEYDEPSLYGVTDGKAVGTYLEHKFTAYLASNYLYAQGNSASGIDIPGLGVDIKVTSIKQPQSSCPFKSASQKVYGLGYNLLIFVYEKYDDHENKELWSNLVYRAKQRLLLMFPPPVCVLVNYFRTLLICNFRSSLGSYNHSPYEAF